MKIIEDNYHENENTKRMTCKYCGSVFEYDELDIIMNDQFGGMSIECPCCGKLIYCNDYYTKNVTFPYSFDHLSNETCVPIDDMRINEWIQDCLDYLRESPKSDFMCISSGDTIVTAKKMVDDNEYEVEVSKDYYKAIVPFDN